MEAWSISRIHLAPSLDKSRYSNAGARRSHALECIGCTGALADRLTA